jgi:hypothetical protein
MRDKICEGVIRARFLNQILPAGIARILFKYNDLEWPDQSGQMPPDMEINRPDVERALAYRSETARRSRGRPKGAGSFEDADSPLIYEINRLISTSKSQSPTAAATKLVDNGLAAGSGTTESKIRRLVRRYLALFGDAG